MNISLSSYNSLAIYVVSFIYKFALHKREKKKEVFLLCVCFFQKKKKEKKKVCIAQ